jgi:hypothetical protein
MRTITITIDDGKIEVAEDGKTTGQLAWDEMLGQIAELTHPAIVERAHYPMLTPEEWEQRAKRLAQPVPDFEFKEVGE